MKRRQHRGRGFTLVEVLVALTIAAVALMASLRAIASLTAAASDLRQRTLAQWSAENRLAELRVTGAFPNVGLRSFGCPQGDLPLLCEEAVYAMPAPLFRRVEVSVYMPDGDLRGPRLTRLVGFVTSLQPVVTQ